MRAEPDSADPGGEPPLAADGLSGGPIDRRRVSVRWFAGTVLTGLCGAALMGGAVYAALDGETHFAAMPERADPALLRGTLAGLPERAAPGPRKSDRLPPPSETSSARQVIRVSTTTRSGDREVVRVRPLVRVASNLSLSSSELAASVPPFNPQKLLAESSRTGGPPASDDSLQAEPDAEVSFVTRDLAGVLAKVKIAAQLPLDDVVARVREAAEWALGQTPQQVASLGPGARLAYATEGDPDPYAGFEARIVPENVTLLPKSAAAAAGANASSERTVIAKKGDSAATLLRDLGTQPDQIKAICALLGPRGRDGGLKEAQRLRVLMASAGPGQKTQPVRVVVMGETAIEAMVAWSETGKFVAVDVQNTDTAVTEAEEDDENDTTVVRLYQSIYETALRNQLPRQVIDDLIRIYSYDVDFQRRVQPGDSFDVLYSGDDDTMADNKNEVLFASLTVGGETKRFYRFQTTDDSTVDYYDETGKSAKKFLVRKPVTNGIMRSGFGMRKHPLLGYVKMHTGVDWAAANGTPIYAAGNGAIEKAGWESGYGKYVRLRHNNGYETAYGHMSAFARGIQPGAKVRQGQLIGYVGSTGLSTGPHLHYEIIVNGRLVDPMRIKLPRGRVLEGALLAGFDRERDKVDATMTRANPARVAQSAR
jgi:murein DD-endopeptidase MepM/ murein hydrolase activator NlpD